MSSNSRKSSEWMRDPSSTAQFLAERFPALQRYCPIFPTVSKHQAVFLLLPNREIFYGGAAGGGKSAALLMAALQYVDIPGYRALILRRTFAQLAKGDALIPLAQSWLTNTDARSKDSGKVWAFPSGATLEFGHAEHEADKYNYQGAAYHFVGFDELTQFTESIYDYIAFSRQRRTMAMEDMGVPIRSRSTANPGGIGHAWVKKRFIDEPKPDVIFIPARVQDNPGLDVADYSASLMHLNEALRKQLLEGDWGAFEGAAFPEFDKGLHVVTDFPDDNAMSRFECMDYGLNNPTAWHLVYVDFDGNIVFGDSYYKPGLPSETAQIILRRRIDWKSTTCYGDPSIYNRSGGVNRWGQPASVGTEFQEAGVNIVRGNNDPRAGYARLKELMKADENRVFPDWHPRRGEKGSPRLFIVGRRCEELVEQIASAPLQPIEKRMAGEMIDPDWEGPHGHAVAAARYGVLTRPTASEAPGVEIEDDRMRYFREMVNKDPRDREQAEPTYI